MMDTNAAPDLDPDLSPLELPPIVVSAFNLENGFVKSFPPELITICRRLNTDLPSEHLVEIIGGGYSFLSWNNLWIIIIGFALTFESNSDNPLTGLIPYGRSDDGLGSASLVHGVSTGDPPSKRN